MARRPLLTDHEILTRARSVFAERGFAVRTRQIAAAVGLTWGAIAPRFGGKRALFTRAMAGTVRGSAAPECEPVGRADLPALFERLSTHLWAHWPLRLQVRLAAAAADTDTDTDDEPQRLAGRLAAALDMHARQGSVRCDLSAETLARVVLALLTGDVAQRYVAHERGPATDPAFIDALCRLLGANPKVSSTHLDHSS